MEGKPDKLEPATGVRDKEKISHAGQIVVVTNFLYKEYSVLPEGEQRNVDDTDGIRGDLALEVLHKAMGLGVRVVASDGGSSADFLKKLESFVGEGLILINSSSPDRGCQRRNVFERATQIPGKNVIVYVQPEKVSLIDHLVEISKPILEGQAEIVIPKRDSVVFEETYPGYMRESEIRVNATYDWLMRRARLMTKDQSFDWFFGPVVFKNDPEIVSLFLKEYEVVGSIKSRIGAETNPEKYSGGHYFPIIEALYNGKKVVSVEIPFRYPETQQKNEMFGKVRAQFIERRKMDAASYRLETLHFLAFLKGDPKSKIREVSQ